MAFCYQCEKEITSENRSVEHIINNSLGGRLKSHDLLCLKCNSSFGEKVDAPIAKAFNVFMNSLNIKKERGEVQDIVGKLQSTTNDFERA